MRHACRRHSRACPENLLSLTECQKALNSSRSQVCRGAAADPRDKPENDGVEAGAPAKRRCDRIVFRDFKIIVIPGSAARPRNDERGGNQCTLPSMQMHMTSTLEVDDGG
jgi:hypothetical protein